MLPFTRAIVWCADERRTQSPLHHMEQVRNIGSLAEPELARVYRLFLAASARGGVEGVRVDEVRVAMFIPWYPRTDADTSVGPVVAL